MTEIREVIDELEREILAGRKDLEAKEVALRLLKDRFGKAEDHPPRALAVAPGLESASMPQQMLDDDLFDVASLVTHGASPRKTFNDKLKDVLRRFGAQEFSIAHAEAGLKRMGVEVSGKTPRSRISASLSKLNEEGFVVKTVEGGGNVPNRYRLRSSLTDEQALDFATTVAQSVEPKPRVQASSVEHEEGQTH